MTSAFVVGAVSADVALGVRHRLDSLLDQSRCMAALGHSADTAAQPYQAHAVPGRAKSLLGFTHMLEVAAKERGRDHLGLELAQVDNDPAHDLLQHFFTFAPTIGRAMEDMVRFFPVFQTGTLVRLSTEGADARFVYSIQDPSVPGSLQDSAYTLGRLFSSVRKVAGSAWYVDRVTMNVPRPRASAAYTDFFQAPVLFDEHATALCFPAAMLVRPVATADAARYARLCDEARRRMLDSSDLSLWEDALRAWMSRNLRSCAPVSLEHAASDFGITPRTLQRRLKCLGINFLDLRAQVRIQAATQLLSESSLSISGIAEKLGFSEISAFTRAFRSQMRQSPRAFRQAGASA